MQGLEAARPKGVYLKIFDYKIVKSLGFEQPDMDSQSYIKHIKTKGQYVGQTEYMIPYRSVWGLIKRVYVTAERKPVDGREVLMRNIHVVIDCAGSGQIATLNISYDSKCGKKFAMAFNNISYATHMVELAPFNYSKDGRKVQGLGIAHPGADGKFGPGSYKVPDYHTRETLMPRVLVSGIEGQPSAKYNYDAQTDDLWNKLCAEVAAKFPPQEQVQPALGATTVAQPQTHATQPAAAVPSQIGPPQTVPSATAAPVYAAQQPPVAAPPPPVAQPVHAPAPAPPVYAAAPAPPVAGPPAAGAYQPPAAPFGAPTYHPPVSQGPPTSQGLDDDLPF